MNEESGGGHKPSGIKPPMIKPPMAVDPPGSSDFRDEARAPASLARGAAPQSAAPPLQNPPPVKEPESGSKIVVIINFILVLALIVGLVILAYRWLK